MSEWFTNDRAVFAAAAVLYAASFAGGVFGLARRGRSYPSLLVWGLLALGLLTHTVAMNWRGIQIQGCPLGNAFEVANFLAWSLVVLVFIVAPAFRLKLLGFFTAGLALALTAVPLAFPGWDAPHSGALFGGNPWIELHAALAIFSYGIFGLLFVVSVMFLIQQRGLKRGRMGGIYAILPSIRQLDVMAVRLLWAGVAFLGGALAVGALFWLRQPELVPVFKLLATLLLWCGYVGIGWLRGRGQLVTRRHAIATIILFVLALFTLWPVESARQDKTGSSSLPQQVCLPIVPAA